MRCVRLSVIGLLVVLGGCSSLSGTWRMTAMDPPIASASFELRQIEFAPDGKHFKATAIHRGEVVEYAGTYAYESELERIVFVTGDGEQRAYHLTLCGGCGVMAVKADEEPRTWTATLERK